MGEKILATGLILGPTTNNTMDAIRNATTSRTLLLPSAAPCLINGNLDQELPASHQFLAPNREVLILLLVLLSR
jgi:hypothetical protein